jgi:ubiquinone biosynthesis protein
LSEFRKRLPEMVTHAPEMPRLLHTWLESWVEGRQRVQIDSVDLNALVRAIHAAQRRIIAAILGTGLLIVAAVLYNRGVGGAHLFGLPAAVWVAGLGGVWALLAAWPRRR